MYTQQDLFISHAGSDKTTYVNPLVESLANADVTYWLDDVEITWGNSVPLKINDGLIKCRFVLICLSENFIHRPWPETEFASALAVQKVLSQIFCKGE
jgi:hypothetical protein